MPFFLRETDVVPEAAGLRSALIVVCRFCPAASLALRSDEPYLEPFRRLLRTASLDRHIAGLRDRLESAGVRTEVFEGRFINMVTCMWTTRQRRRLRERAHGFEAAIVLGCEGAHENMREILELLDNEKLLERVKKIVRSVPSLRDPSDDC